MVVDEIKEPQKNVNGRGIVLCPYIVTILYIFGDLTDWDCPL